jgi:hypothetical protein
VLGDHSEHFCQSSRPNQPQEAQTLLHLAWLAKVSAISTPYATIVIVIAVA